MVTAVRVGLLHPGAHGALDDEVWSGIPLQLQRALESIGVSVTCVGVRPPRLLRRVVGGFQRVRGRDSRLLNDARDLTAEMQLTAGAAVKVRQVAALASARQRHPWIVMGSSFGVPLGSDLVTYDDITVAQAAESGDFGLRVLPGRDIVLWKRNQARLYTKATSCCTASTWAARSLIDAYRVPARKVRVIGFGANVEAQPADRDWSNPSFLLIGTDWHRKNGDRVIRAFTKLREEMPAAQLHVVGNHPRIDVSGVMGHGYLRRGVPGERARFEALLRNTTCLVMPSLAEPFGIAYVDAGRAGIPSIGTTIGGAADAIGPGGLTVDPYSVTEICQAMRQVAVPEVAMSLGRKAFTRSAFFTWDQVARRVLHALRIEPPDGRAAMQFLP